MAVWKLALAITGVALSLGACRSEEQDRPLSYSPGVYQGAKDQALDEDTRKALRERGALGH